MMSRRTSVLGRGFEVWSSRCEARRSAVLLACAGVALTLGAATLLASSAPSFAPARSYATGSHPRSITIGDLNGDGKRDLVNANQAAHSVSVLLNRGDGSFQPKLDYRTGRNPISVAIGDLNGDGRPDLATANGDENVSSVSVLLNRGNGSFKARRAYATGSYSFSVAIGDLNGDGKRDLAITNAGGDDVSVLFNSGDGTFQAKRDYATASGPNSVAIGDLNGDGKPDLAVAGSDGVSVLLNRGDGSFQGKSDYTIGGIASDVAIGDLNGDGQLDLTTANNLNKANAGNTVSVLLNRGDGTFQAKRDYETGYGPDSVAIGDLNGDGRPELATANSEYETSTVSVLLNSGDGSFRAKQDYAIGPSAADNSVAIGYVNGDGKRDLAAANAEADTVFVFANATGRCGVPNVKGMTLLTARRALIRGDCRVGRIRRAYSTDVKRGRVISQKPRLGSVLPKGAKVNLVVSRGRRR